MRTYEHDLQEIRSRLSISRGHWGKKLPVVFLKKIRYGANGTREKIEENGPMEVEKVSLEGRKARCDR